MTDEYRDYYASLPKVAPKTPLSCGCCGTYFRTWEGYQNQDQDQGYGICRPCQARATARNEAEWDKLESLVVANLNEKNRAVYASLDTAERRGLILTMIEDGVIVWEFQPAPGSV